MSGDGAFGAVGAAPGVRNPVAVAAALLAHGRRGLMPLGRIPPLFLAGDGARRWAADHGLAAGEAGDGETTHQLPGLGRLFLVDVALHRRPAAAAPLHRPAGRDPALAIQDALPTDEVVLAHALVLQHLARDVGGKFGLEEATHLVAEGAFRGGVLDVHTEPCLTFEADAATRTLGRCARNAEPRIEFA